MSKTPALLTPLPQRVPLRNTVLNTNKTATVKRASELPRRVPLKFEPSQVKLTSALPQRVPMDIEHSERSTPPQSGRYPITNYRYSRTEGTKKEQPKQGNKEFDVLRKRLTFDEDSLSDNQSNNDDVKVIDDNVIVQDNQPSLSSISNMSDLKKISSEPIKYQENKLNKKLLDTISCPFEDRELFSSECHPVFDKLRKLAEKENGNNFNMFEEINKLLSFKEAKLKDSTEVYINIKDTSEKVRMKIKYLQDVDSAIQSLFTTSIGEVFRDAVSVKSVGKVVESVKNITNQSIKKSVPQTFKIKTKYLDQKITPFKNESILPKSKSMTLKNDAHKEVKFGIFKNSSTVKKVSSKSKTHVTSLNENPQTDFNETSRDKENVEEYSVLAVTHEINIDLRKDGETVDGANTYPTTPVSSKSILRNLYSDTKSAQVFDDISNEDEEENSKKSMSPL